METTLQTKCYQDPHEVFEKRFPWSVVFTSTDLDAPVNISADDWSGREITLPLGVIFEIAEKLRATQPSA